jgi:hypothetical protein
MKGRMFIIKTNGDISMQELVEAPTLDVLQKGVGGYIEKVPMFDTWDGKTCVCFCNEEGKLNSLPLNQVATNAWFHQNLGAISDVLVGDVVILTGDTEFMESL